MRVSNSDLEDFLKSFDQHILEIKEEIFKISWYMRGGVTSHDLFFVYSFEDRDIMSKLIKDNIDATKKSGLPLL